LHVILLPTDKTAFDWQAAMETARPIAGLALMGVIAPAATIYSARAASFPPTLTGAAVGLELALACMMARPAMTARRGHRLQ
jgi:hypothetical protein